jgi:hypothetical protein
MVLAVAQQFAGLTIISTYSTCALHAPLSLSHLLKQAADNSADFFALAGLKDPFKGTVILS